MECNWYVYQFSYLYVGTVTPYQKTLRLSCIRYELSTQKCICCKKIYVYIINYKNTYITQIIQIASNLYKIFRLNKFKLVSNIN